MRKTSFVQAAALSLSLISASVLLSACDMSVPSQVRVGKIQVQEKMQTITLDASYIDEARLSIVAEDYLRTGKSDHITVLVTYTDGDQYAAQDASQNAERYRQLLKKYGVKNAKVDIIGTDDLSRVDQAIISYRAMQASAPDECVQNMPGYDGATPTADMKDYQIGCHMDSMVSQMVSDPQDFLGKGGTTDGDARRQGIVVEPNKSGVPNEPLQGLQASGLGEEG